MELFSKDGLNHPYWAGRTRNGVLTQVVRRVSILSMASTTEFIGKTCVLVWSDSQIEREQAIGKVLRENETAEVESRWTEPFTALDLKTNTVVPHPRYTARLRIRNDS